MKKMIFILPVMAIAVGTAYGIHITNEMETQSEIMLANIEALARGEHDPNIFYGYKLTNCMNNGAIIGATCKQGWPDDQCRMSGVWGNCY